MDDIFTLKKQARRQCRKIAAGLSNAQCLEAGSIIASKLKDIRAFADSGTVFCFVSMAGEPDTHRLIECMLRTGKRVAVPRCKGDGVMELVAINSLSRLRPGTMGIFEPEPGLPLVAACEVDFAVIPAAACGEDMSRLGHGAGYYDRFLAAYGGPSAAAVMDELIFPSLPMGDFDIKMEMIITEKRVITP